MGVKIDRCLPRYITWERVQPTGIGLEYIKLFCRFIHEYEWQIYTHINDLSIAQYFSMVSLLEYRMLFLSVLTHTQYNSIYQSLISMVVMFLLYVYHLKMSWLSILCVPIYLDMDLTLAVPRFLKALRDYFENRCLSSEREFATINYRNHFVDNWSRQLWACCWLSALG